jgi:glycosyltransferase involved in cell wall biosynthesis
MFEPRVSVVLVARDEPPARLRQAVASVERQDYTGEIEILAATPAADHDALPPSAIWIDNPNGARSAGLNLALAVATGSIVCRIDARSTLPPDYVRRCVARLSEDAAVGVVGGRQRPAVDATNKVMARGIVRALRNPWALGGADYRRPGRFGPTDTVYLGAFRRDELLVLGGYDEHLDANEDFDMAQRYRRAGFTVWLEDVAVDYEPRRKLGAVWRQYSAFGRAKVRYWRRTGERPNRRQLLALVGAPLLVVAWPLIAVLDHLAEPHERSVRVRCAAVMAYVVIVGGWLAGVVAEVTARRS